MTENLSPPHKPSTLAPVLLGPPRRPEEFTNRSAAAKVTNAPVITTSGKGNTAPVRRLTADELVARKAKSDRRKKTKLSAADVEALQAAKLAAQNLVEAIREAVEIGEILTVSGIYKGKKRYGAFYEVTTPGETRGLIGLWHISDMPGGAEQLDALAQSETPAELLQIIWARVETSDRKPVVRLSLAQTISQPSDSSSS